MKKIILLAVLTSFMLISCEENPPVTVEGNSLIKLVAFWHSVPGDSTSALLPMSSAKVILSSEYGTMTKSLDENGQISIAGLPSATYSISIRKAYPDDASIQLIYSIKNVAIKSGGVYTDSVVADPVSSSGIAINEVYCAGPINNIYFFYDQFIELYNASDSVKYLDGMMVMRFSGNNEDGALGPGADEGNDGDIDGAVYVFKFPGKPGETNYPFPPKTFLVLAQDAINHKTTVSTSVDLSGADWEFYNQYSSIDIDNPNVPNLLNMRSESTVDFMINLTSDVIVVSSGVDSVWDDGIDISTVIDAMEYQSSASTKKTLDERVDRGFALSPAKYSGQSMERREAGQDTNDGTLDWEIIPYPTPGYQH